MLMSSNRGGAHIILLIMPFIYFKYTNEMSIELCDERRTFMRIAHFSTEDIRRNRKCDHNIK